MNDRLITTVGAIGALFAVYALLVPRSGEIPVTWPQSEEPGRNGYLALARWLESEGVPVVSWRERFDDLLDEPAGLTRTGNVLLMTMPQRFRLREREQQQVLAWIRRGNTVLILAALNDSPEWLEALSADGNEFITTLAALTGLRIGSQPAIDGDTGEPIETNRAAPGEAVVLRPVEHPLMQDVERLEALSDAESSKWFVRPTTGYAARPYFRLARDAESGGDAAWQIPLGNGQILMFASGSLLANHLIADSDGATLVANILDWHLGPGGSFVFDDMHQGLSSLYDPTAFYADRRLHGTIAFLIAAWLVYLLGTSNRIAPPRPERSEPRQAELLAGIGGFMARRLAPRDTGRRLFEEWFGDIRRQRGLGDRAEPPWDALAASPTLAPDLLLRLRRDFERLHGGYTVDLVGLHNRIRRARKAIG